jgi:hypothetical protein
MSGEIGIDPQHGSKIAVYHAKLQRFADSTYTSECPFCAEGLLMMRRNPVTLILSVEDWCNECGQHVVYTDIEPGLTTLTYKQAPAAA